MVISVKTKRGRKYVVGNNCDRIEDHVFFFDVYIDNKIIRVFDTVEAELDLTNPANCGTVVMGD